MRILLVEDETDLRELLVFTLENALDARVVEARSGQEAISLLKRDSAFDCIVCDYVMPEGTGGDVHVFMEGAGLRVPFVLCSSYHPERFPEFVGKKIAGHVIKPLITQPLIEIVRSLKPSAPPPSEPEYYRIRLETLVKVAMMGCDLFVRLGDGKYVKVLRPGDRFESADLARYTAKQIEYLYLRKEDTKQLIDRLSRDIAGLGAGGKDVALEVYQEIAESAHEVIREVVGKLGVTPEVQALTRKCVELAVKTLGKDPRVGETFRSMLVRRQNYLSSHSVVLAHLSCAIAHAVGWTSEPTFYKLALASFFHDLPLQNHDLARIQTLDELEMARDRFSRQEVAAFREHPLAAAKLVGELADFPADVDAIVAQHHERPDGTGFPNQLGALRLHPLACVFIVSHDLANFLQERGSAVALSDFSIEMSGSYQQGVFKKILEGILNQKS
jgi:HD-GYP domain-containing protein (c-di-GMP phosphodiesterase class II)/CheY-like chemotaxis protein